MHQLTINFDAPPTAPATTETERRMDAKRRGVCTECGADLLADLEWLTWGEMGFGWCRSCSAAVGVVL